MHHSLMACECSQVRHDLRRVAELAAVGAATECLPFVVDTAHPVVKAEPAAAFLTASRPNQRCEHRLLLAAGVPEGFAEEWTVQ
jgi:hypothetical protein